MKNANFGRSVYHHSGGHKFHFNFLQFKYPQKSRVGFEPERMFPTLFYRTFYYYFNDFKIKNSEKNKYISNLEKIPDIFNVLAKYECSRVPYGKISRVARFYKARKCKVVHTSCPLASDILYMRLRIPPLTFFSLTQIVSRILKTRTKSGNFYEIMLGEDEGFGAEISN